MNKPNEDAIRDRAGEVARTALLAADGEAPLEALEEAFDDLHRAVVNLGGGRVWARSGQPDGTAR